jgi:hypothetical protein
MAVTSGTGFSRVLEKRHFEDYKSLKQSLGSARFNEVIIEGTCTTAGAASEISFVTGDVIDYIAAEGQVYIRCEADDANQHSKYVYIQYQDDTGAIKTVLTADLNAANSTTEVIVTGASDFYRLRQMISEVESDSGGGKMVVLCDADWDSAADSYGLISDGQSAFCLERFFTQPTTTCTSYLAYVKAITSYVQEGDAVASGFLVDVTFTPKPVSTPTFAEAQVAADVTQRFQFTDELVWQPCIELDGGTEVIFKVGDLGTAGKVHIEAVMVEVYL